MLNDNIQITNYKYQKITMTKIPNFKPIYFTNTIRKEWPKTIFLNFLGH